MKILIVDDARTMRMFLANIVQEMGFTVIEAADGRDALKKLSQETPVAAALVDIDMPGLNGLEFLREVRQSPQYQEVKIMMISSHTTMEAVEQAIESGAQDYLMKPLTKAMLEDKFRVLGLL